jgi:hypothetical protein
VLACAEVDLGKVWINAGFYSYHFDRHKGLEDANPGIGFEYPIDETYAFTAGAYRNSDREHSHYVGVYIRPFEFHGVKLGLATGLFDGYSTIAHGGWFPAVLPTAAIEGRNWGLNISLVPSFFGHHAGSISFQLKYRFSDGE